MCHTKLGALHALHIELELIGMKGLVNPMPAHRSPPTISFDYFYTKANGEAATADDPDTIIALVVVCSQTSFVKSIPLESKNQMDHMNREVIQFIQMLGHTDVSLRCDNEPSILQLKRLLVKTRQAMGLRTLESSAVAYDHGNSLAENAVGRVRPLAASLMHQLHGRLGIQLSTSSAVWTWALRHAAWILSRFAVVRGATAYELCFGRPFKGELCEFGEPVFGYVVPETKASAKWKRMICLGKADTQSSYILFDGQSILLSRCIRRINTTWRSHMAYYLHCRCFSWQFRTGFGARILPTMKKAVQKQASFALPLEPVELNKLHDKDAEDVFQHAQDEKKAEEERQAMAEHDSLGMDSGQRLETLLEETSADAKETTPFTAVSTSAPMQVEASSASVPSKDVVVIDDPGLAVPVTPPRDDSPGARPRASSAVRPSDGESEEMLKKQKTEESKRQRINQLKAEYEQRLTAVKLAYKEYFTVDDYSTELDAEDVSEDDVWAGEDGVTLSAVPEALWIDADVDKAPIDAPEKWIDDLADQLEIQRLTQMEVLVPAGDFQGAITGKLTTRFVRDWRLKDFGDGDSMRKRWMRRSRLVAREFNNSKRLDTFSPATGSHTNNLLPLKYLFMKGQSLEMPAKEEYSVVMGCCDVKDAFLQVSQDEPILVSLQGQPFVIQKNLPGQRLGAKQWFLFLKEYLQSSMGFEFLQSNLVWRRQQKRRF